MKKIGFLALVLGTMAFGAQTIPTNYDNWLPNYSVKADSYGYSVDSHFTYNWIDITTIGTQVTGLGDDNNTGPFNIGFSFPYYWYQTDKFWVNSNGAISLSSSAVYMPQSDGFNVPNSKPPNDLLIPLGADLAFDASTPDAKCYYYTNNKDSLVVSFIKVPAWLSSGLAGAHSFQIILNKADSTIVFQYEKQESTFYQNKDVAGIENITGKIGLQYFTNRIPTSGEVVRFVPPDSTSYIAKDVGIYEALTEESEGYFVIPNVPKPLLVTVKNYGNIDATDIGVKLEAKDISGATQFTLTDTISALSRGETTVVDFGSSAPPTTGIFIIFAKTTFAGDINTGNDSVRVEVVSMNYPGWLSWDNNPSKPTGASWAGVGGGWGQEFEPPAYPAVIESVAFAVVTAKQAVDLPVYLMDDDGSAGGPGTVLYADTVHIDTSATFKWHTIPISSDTITSGKFYVGLVRMQTDSFLSMMQDTSEPASNRSWENTGVWAPFRSKNDLDVMIRAFVANQRAVEESNIAHFVDLQQNIPNPVKGKTTINFSINKEARVSVKIYNLGGQLVRTLLDGNVKAGLNSIIWDGTDNKGKSVSTGIYFYELKSDNFKRTKKLVLVK